MGIFPPSILRLPPQPPSRQNGNDGSLMAGVMDPNLSMMANEEGNREKVGSNCASVNCRTRPYYFRRCKKKRLTNIESLPDELVFEILLHLQAKDIYVPARLVCSKWYHMIHTHSFIYAHLHDTAYGLLFFYAIGLRDPFSLAMRQGRIEMSKFSYRFRCAVWTSCNGLVLECEAPNPYVLYIVNPITKQRFVLPPILCDSHKPYRSGMAYAAASMEYKVVLPYASDSKSNGQRYAILTVGVDDSWRHVQTEHLSPISKKLFYRPPLITEGFMHWVTKDAHVFTLNVETEIIMETPVPFPQVYGEEKEKYIMSTGRHLSLLMACGKFLWEVWEMKPETGEWTKLPDINLGAQKCTSEQLGCKHDETLLPVGWLNYPELLVFRFASQGHACIFYNFHTHEIGLIQLPVTTTNYIIRSHKNSLVWLGGC